MKKYLLGIVLLNMACSGDTVADKFGVVSGKTLDGSGKPLAGVTILIDNSIFFNSHLSTRSDVNGSYMVTVPTGAWYAFAQLKVIYNNLEYQLYLHPDNPSGFGGEGAIRNFSWKLTGEKPAPLSGYYGGLVTIDNFPGVYLENDLIEFHFTAEGNLVDGSPGQVLTRKTSDGNQIQDIPIGRYTVTAHYKTEKLKLRRWNSDDVFQESLTFDFQPQIAGQCDNCFKLEYNK
ncbi:carboxypeptidase regulatory-like domain-containing protein [Sphingobacterium olei]|uniref:Carboxypeptidase regulatory-like domain-containing protein n=1 Tax=Sphingobacterium olei TaxID=2571155 RepID=A0A4U0P649_9SPHI|nr:carboxypeptidase-like regulatory domain-containing protein [Sphingobacterium olei]TJZ62895.1 carboxypeptidase regulatory-like domain-containing protein [Sphingobacterium olei]